MPEGLRSAVAHALGLNAVTDVRVRRSVPTHVYSEVLVIVTTGGEDLIAKQFLGTDADRRFEAELTTLEALSAVGAPVARLRGADRESLVVITEALDGPTIEDVIRTTDREDAEKRLISYAEAIGTFHSMARQAADRISSARSKRGFSPSVFWPTFARDPGGAAERLSRLSETPPDELGREITQVTKRTFEDSDGDTTIIHWDTWPGNAIALRDRVVLVDFEHSMLGQGLIDVSSWHLAFPAAPLRSPYATPIPDWLIALMDRAYTHATGRVISAVDFAFAVASRMLFELTAPSAWKLTSGPLADEIRVLYALRLARAAEILQHAAALPTLTTVMRNVSVQARSLVAGAKPLQTSPALR